MKIYIAGKVTGLPIDECNLKFQKAEDELVSEGHEVVNPMKIVPPSATWDYAMQVCIDALEQCEAIYLLSDWVDSKGAKIELRMAREFKLEILQEVA